MDFKDKVAIVMGGGQGLGRATVLAFARQGAHVAVLDQDIVKARIVAQEAKGFSVDALPLRLFPDRYEETIDPLLKEINLGWGRLDYLVNIIRTPAWPALWEATEEQWREIHAQFNSAFFWLQRASLQMRGKEGCCIINVVSTSSIYEHGHGVLGASMTALTRWSARQLGPHGIRVNAVIPVVARPEFSEKPEIMEGEFNLINVACDPLVSAVLFLCSQGASYVTGHTLTIHWKPLTKTDLTGGR